MVSLKTNSHNERNLSHIACPTVSRSTEADFFFLLVTLLKMNNIRQFFFIIREKLLTNFCVSIYKIEFCQQK